MTILLAILKTTVAFLSSKSATRAAKMLILTRKAGESITIGDNVRVIILEMKGNQVRVGIDAPRSIPVYREELFRLIHTREAAARVVCESTGPVVAPQ